MKVWTTLDAEDLEAIAAQEGVVILWGRQEKIGRAYNFRLGLDRSVPKRGNAGFKYQRTSSSSWSEGRKVNAVCWHGYRDYMRAVFRRDQDARFKTAVADWKGSEDFELRFVQSGFRNVGSMMIPAFAKDVCTCSYGEWNVDSSPGGSYIMNMDNQMIKACPHVIFSPSHFRADGTCKCNDKNDADMAEWGYTWSDSEGRWAA